MCGIVGVFNHPQASAMAYYALHALQHRGQEAAGIVTLYTDQQKQRRGEEKRRREERTAAPAMRDEQQIAGADRSGVTVLGVEGVPALGKDSLAGEVHGGGGPLGRRCEQCRRCGRGR